MISRPYTPQTWTDDVDETTADRLNHIEAGILRVGVILADTFSELRLEGNLDSFNEGDVAFALDTKQLYRRQTEDGILDWYPLAPTVAAPTWRAVGAAGQPAFESGWVNYGTPWYPAAFAKDALGVVRVRGLVKSGTATGSVFTLPVGYRPSQQLIFIAATNTATVAARVDVTSAGVILPGAGVNNGWLSLKGITFSAEA